MIQNIQYIPPYINFGFGVTTKLSTIHKPITVWLSTLYNQEAYTFSLTGPGTITKVSNYQYTIAHNVPGLYNIQLVVTLKATNTPLESNILYLTLTP